MDDDDDDEGLKLKAEEALARFTFNRLMCAISGPIGKSFARTTDVVLDAMGAQPKVRQATRMVLGQGGALVMTALGAPEAALSIMSSYGSHSSKDQTDPQRGPTIEVTIEED